MRGVIDLIYPEADGTYHILDYKTGRRTEQSDNAHHLQMQAYALCLQQLYPQQSEYRATVYYVESHERQSDPQHLFCFDRDQLALAQKDLEDLIAQLVISRGY